MLSITNGTNTPLTTSLQAQGLSSQKARLVETDLAASIATVGGANATVGGANATTKADPAAVRQAFDTRIASDVASGKLSQDDADKIGKALDDMAAKSGDSPVASEAAAGTGTAAPTTASSAPAGAARHGGGGGGGGGSSKTEVSETVTVAGGIETTTITYSDGSTETTTGVATGADAAKAAASTATPAETNAASAYAPQMPPGALIDATG